MRPIYVPTFSLFFLALLLLPASGFGKYYQKTPVRPPLVVVTDGSWEVSSEPTAFGEYPLSAAQIPGPATRLKGGSKSAVRAAFFQPSRIISGTVPIWSQAKASEDWEARQFRKTVALDQTPLQKVTLQINCDDAARVYINQRLVNPDGRNGYFNDARGRNSLFRNLTALLYSEVRTYDVTDYFFTGVTNTIIVEVANQPIGDNHAYLSASITVEFTTVPEVQKQAVRAPARKTTPRPAPETPAARPETRPAPATAAENSLSGSGSTVAVKDLRVGTILKLENVYFKEDEYKLDSTSYRTLSVLADFLKANPNLKIEVGGHTNLLPDDQFADWLSENRSRVVAKYLVDNGVGRARITFKGYGKSAPKAAGTGREANRKNQRVEVKITGL
jgi:outer membrane protein OmpA-like peptidoglycan-associated protein